MLIKFIKTALFALCLFTGLSSRAQGTAYIQIIHNCADTTLDTVDLYMNGQALDTPFVFGQVYGFFTDTSGISDTFQVLQKHSNGDFSKLIKSFTYTFEDDQLYILLLSGVLDTANYAPNPNGLNTSFNLDVASKDSASTDDTVVAIKFFNAVTDLPGVAFLVNDTPFGVNENIVYGDTNTTDTVHYGVYEFSLFDTATGRNYGTFFADLSNLDVIGGQSVFIVASGFLNVAKNDSGPAIALNGILNDGTILPFPLDTANFQLLNNCADTSADSLNIFINGILTFPKLAFRNATPEFSVKAYATYDIGIATKNDTSVNDTFWHSVYLFGPDTFHIATISGLIDTTGYAPNPNGISTAFGIIEKSPAELTGSSSQNFDFYFLNGVTDAPQLGIMPQGGPEFSSLRDITYTQQSNYASLPAEFYELTLQDTPGNTLGNYFANFLAFQGQSGVLLTSGFLNPDNNHNGPGLGLYLVPTWGGPFIPLFIYTSIPEVKDLLSTRIFPNPASDNIFIRFNLTEGTKAQVEITDMNGNPVKQLQEENTSGKDISLQADISDLSEGMYWVRIICSEGISNSRFVIAR